MNGLLVIDKPGGMTSRDAVNRAQKWFPRTAKVGHTGTLDPLATGVLVLCVGAATRLAEFVQAMGKGYATRIRLGATSDTDDADGVLTPVAGATPPTEEQVRAALAPLVGTISQLPPAYSALKVNGKRAHELARSGAEVKLAPRPVSVYRIDLLKYDWPHLDLSVECGKGTYIRSLARDLGAALGVGGLVQTLRRTHVGPFTADSGLSLDTDPATVPGKLRPMGEAVADLPRVTLDADAARRFCTGQAMPCGDVTGVAAVFRDGEFVGVGEAAGGRVRPKVVI
jgi:tRNA pseudouridine55 synthase